MIPSFGFKKDVKKGSGFGRVSLLPAAELLKQIETLRATPAK